MRKGLPPDHDSHRIRIVVVNPRFLAKKSGDGPQEAGPHSLFDVKPLFTVVYRDVEAQHLDHLRHDPILAEMTMARGFPRAISCTTCSVNQGNVIVGSMNSFVTMSAAVRPSFILAPIFS
jgi:hypothetical protein